MHSRIVGYYSPLGRWNKGKRKEWEDRVTYNLQKTIRELKEASVTNPG